MKRSASAILLSLFLGCLAYRFFVYYKTHIPIISMDSMGAFTVIVIGLLVPAAACVLAVASAQRPKSTRRPQARPSAKLPELTLQEEKLCRQLIEMLNGDQDAAQWLFYQSTQANPNRDVMWHLNQVIQTVKHHCATQPTAPLSQPPQRQQQPAAQSRKEQELQRQLLNLLNGDQGTAQRLLQLSLERNGHRDAVWHLDKVIYDLVRDRGGKPIQRDYRDYRDC